jgi:hypothetical protein
MFEWAGWQIIKKFLPLIIGALVVLTLIGAIMGYGRARYNQGVAEAEAEYKPKIQACLVARDGALAANKSAMQAIDNLKSAYGDLESAVKMLEARERAARIRGDRLAAEFAKREREYVQEAQRLKAIIEGPRLSPQEACAGADKLLTEEARARVGRISQ